MVGFMSKTIKKIICILVACSWILTGCESMKTPKVSVSAFTLGKIQQKLHIGMSATEVTEFLGSPNMVSTDSKHNEVWVYDKMSTVDSAFLGHSSTSQSTITVIIKFDNNDKVRDFSYHQSKF